MNRLFKLLVRLLLLIFVVILSINKTYATASQVNSISRKDRIIYYFNFDEKYLTYDTESSTLVLADYTGYYNQRWIIKEYGDNFNLYSYELLYEKFGSDILHLTNDCSFVVSDNSFVRAGINDNIIRIRKVPIDDNNSLFNLMINSQNIYDYINKSYDNIQPMVIVYPEDPGMPPPPPPPPPPVQIDKYRRAVIVVPGYLGSELFFNSEKIFSPNIVELQSYINTDPSTIEYTFNMLKLVNKINYTFEHLYFHEQSYLHPELTNKPKYDLTVTKPIVITKDGYKLSDSKSLEYTYEEFSNEFKDLDTCQDYIYMLNNQIYNNAPYIGTLNMYCSIVDKLAQDFVFTKIYDSAEIVNEVAFFHMIGTIYLL
jgi:hypothetical protein